MGDLATNPAMIGKLASGIRPPRSQNEFLDDIETLYSRLTTPTSVGCAFQCHTMTSRVNHARIHTARSLEETERILREAEGKGLSFRAKSFLLKLWVPAANTLLKLLSALLFRNRGMRDSDIRRIVIYNVGIVGDNVVMLPAIAALRKRFPEAAITVVSNCQTWDQGNGKMDEIKKFEQKWGVPIKPQDLAKAVEISQMSPEARAMRGVQEDVRMLQLQQKPWLVGGM